MLSEFTKTGQRRAQRRAGHLKDPFERPIEFQDQKNRCKSCGVDEASLSWDAVKEVVAGEAAYRLRHPGVAFHKACITNQFFNSTAQKHAELNNVELLGQTHLARILEEFPVTMLDVERLRYAEWERKT